MADAAAIPLFNPSGDLIDVPATSVQAALRQGWQQATPEQVAAYEREEKFGTTGQQLATFAEGVGKGVLGPVIPAVEQAFGVPAEDIRARAETNPFASGAGVATGIVGSIAAPVGAGAKAFTLPGVASKVGQAAKVATEGTGLTGLAGRALPAAAGMAAETAIYGASDVAERAVLQDPNLTAEQALATVGVSGLFGGVLGGGGVLAKEAFGKAFTKAYDAAQRAYVATKPEAEQARTEFSLKLTQDIVAAEKKVGGIAESIVAANPETQAYLVRPDVVEAIADLEKKFPGVHKVLARQNPDTVERILSQRGKLTTDVLERFRYADKQAKIVQQAYDSIGESLGKVYDAERPAEVSRLASGIAEDAAYAEAEGIVAKLDDAIAMMSSEENKAVFPAMYPSRLRDIKTRLADVLPRVDTRWVPGAEIGKRTGNLVPGGTPAEVYKSIDDAKRILGSFTKFNRNITPEHEYAQNFLKGLYRDVRLSLENEGVWGKLGARQRDFNKAVHQFFDAETLLEQELFKGRAQDKRLSLRKVNTWINQMADPRGDEPTRIFQDYITKGKALADEMEKSGLAEAPAVRSRLEALEKATGDIAERAEVLQIVKQATTNGPLSSGPAIPMEGDIARSVVVQMPGGSVVSSIEGVIKSATATQNVVGVFGALQSMAAKTSAAVEKGINVIFGPLGTAGAAAEAGHLVKPSDFQKVAEAVRSTAADLEGTATKVAAATSGFADHAPETTASTHGAAARGVSHLAEKLPTQQTHSPLDPPHEPSKAELAAFSRRLDIANNPTRVLAHIATGSLTPEHIETLQVVYPALANDMRAQLMERVASEIAGGRTIPYRTRVQLSMFLGGDLDSTTKPAAISANQQALASIQAQQQANEAAQNVAMSKLTLAARTATPAQSAANRRA